MGVACKALDTHLDRFVAFKVLPPEGVADPVRKACFVLDGSGRNFIEDETIG